MYIHVCICTHHIDLSICLSVYLSVYLSIYPLIHPTLSHPILSHPILIYRTSYRIYCKQSLHIKCHTSTISLPYFYHAQDATIPDLAALRTAVAQKVLEPGGDGNTTGGERGWIQKRPEKRGIQASKMEFQQFNHQNWRFDNQQ